MLNDWHAALLVILLAIWILSSREDENVVPRGIINKFLLYCEGIIFMILSKDNKGLSKKGRDPADVKKLGLKTNVKRIVFIRHGESDWNEVFNKGFGPMLLVRLIKAMIREAKIYHTMDSIFLDSPLNHDGFEQAKELGKFIDGSIQNPDGKSESVQQVLKVLRNGSKDSIIVSSTLRRAISTVVVGLWQRIKGNNEKLHLLSTLQEISRNIDTKALSASKTLPDVARIACYQTDFNVTDNQHMKYFDCSEHNGNKSTSFVGLKRINAFSEWVFGREENIIIVSGHSLWFKYFFQRYLPHESNHIAKSSKIHNSGVVTFELHRGVIEATGSSGSATETLYYIDENSIESVYRGFELPSSSSKSKKNNNGHAKSD